MAAKRYVVSNQVAIMLVVAGRDQPGAVGFWSSAKGGQLKYQSSLGDLTSTAGVQDEAVPVTIPAGHIRLMGTAKRLAEFCESAWYVDLHPGGEATLGNCMAAWRVLVTPSAWTPRKRAP